MYEFRKLSRLSSSAAVALFALTISANAEGPSGALSVVPTAVSVAYNLAPGAVSAPIKLPANFPIHLVGVNLTVGQRGVGEASLLSIAGVSGFVEWVGLNSTTLGTISQGFTGAAGTTIIFIDFSQQVSIEVASTNAIQVHNLSTGTETGRVTFSY